MLDRTVIEAFLTHLHEDCEIEIAEAPGEKTLKTDVKTIDGRAKRLFDSSQRILPIFSK